MVRSRSKIAIKIEKKYFPIALHMHSHSTKKHTYDMITKLLHIVNNPKVMADGAYWLETHITGVKVHGRFTMMFIDSDNLTMTPI